jgi:hypothetical protein
VRRTIATALVLAFGLVGCADSQDVTNDDTEDVSQEQTTPSEEGTNPGEEETTPGEEETTPADEPAGDDEELIRETLLTWDFEGDCNLVTDKFLEDYTFISGDREQACQYVEKTFVEKLYSEDDVIIDNVQVDGDTATADFGSTIAPDLTITYTLVRQDGVWVIDGYDF